MGKYNGQGWLWKVRSWRKSGMTPRMTGVTEKWDMVEEIEATLLFPFWFYRVWTIQQTAVHIGLELRGKAYTLQIRWDQKR